MAAAQSVQQVDDLGSILNQSINQRERMAALETQVAQNDRVEQLAVKQDFPLPDRIR